MFWNPGILCKMLKAGLLSIHHGLARTVCLLLGDVTVSSLQIIAAFPSKRSERCVDFFWKGRPSIEGSGEGQLTLMFTAVKVEFGRAPLFFEWKGNASDYGVGDLVVFRKPKLWKNQLDKQRIFGEQPGPVETKAAGGERTCFAEFAWQTNQLEGKVWTTSHSDRHQVPGILELFGGEARLTWAVSQTAAWSNEPVWTSQTLTSSNTRKSCSRSRRSGGFILHCHATPSAQGALSLTHVWHLVAGAGYSTSVRNTEYIYHKIRFQ